jgi:hypothetical protein
MHDILDRDVPWVLIEFRVIYALYHDWYIPSHEPNPFAYTYLKFSYSDSARRSEKAKEWTEAPFWPGFLTLVALLVPLSLMGLRIFKQR